jgi:hypothetical protein
LELIASATARRGTVVPLALRLTNITHNAVEVHFLGREIAFDIVVARTDGTVVWRRLGGMTVPSILQMRVLAPGEIMGWRDEWRPREAGEYVAWAELPSDGPTLKSEPIRLVVSP